MSDHVIGIAAKITSKEAGKNNNLIYSICVEEDGQDDTWFGYGWDEPQFTEGAEIEFDIEYNGDYLNIDVASLNVIRDGEPKRSSRSSGGRSGGGRSSGGRSSGGRSSGGNRGGNSRSKPAASRGSKSRSKPAAKDNDTTMSKDDWNKKDQMIRRQACMNTAIKLIGLMQTAGVLPKPKTKSDGFDALAALCDEEAIRLFDQYEEQVYGGGTSKRGNSKQNDNQYDDDIPE
jgi:hypothetical protein